ncbi:hypothetical protein [Peribacillus saganii]|nr:hypothetical protein [Peribacillus saganii]
MKQKIFLGFWLTNYPPRWLISEGLYSRQGGEPRMTTQVKETAINKDVQQEMVGEKSGA